MHTALSVTSDKKMRKQLMMDIGKPVAAAAPSSGSTLASASSCVSSQRHRTLRRNAEKGKRQDHLRAVSLPKLPFVLLRLPPRCAGAHYTPTLQPLLVERAQVRSHQAGIPESVSHRDNSGDNTDAQYRHVGCLVFLADRKIAAQ